MTTLDYSTKASIGLTQRIPGGYFNMGSRFHPRENPSQQVFISEFDIANIPVTVGQYGTFVESGAYQQERWWTKPGWDWLNLKTDGWGRENRELHAEQARLLGAIRERDEKMGTIPSQREPTSENDESHK